ncbi:MAG TPA: hypothetical protein VJA21_16180 [Verrucomicrobiae bacterium]
MNNPNPFYSNGPAEDSDDIDPERFLEQFIASLDCRRIEIRRWMEQQEFLEVRVRELPARGEHCYEVLAIRGPDDECRTFGHVLAIVRHLAGDLGLMVQEDEFCAVVWGDRVGTQFRLRPQAA